MNQYKKTLVVNLYGGPGSGKSTGATRIFSGLKMRGVDAEYTPEFAKDLVWEGNLSALDNQLFVTGTQIEKIRRLLGKVEVVVTDSPPLMGLAYCKANTEKEAIRAAYVDLIVSQPEYSSLAFFLHRAKPYNPNGRTQTAQESDELSKKIHQIPSQYAGQVPGNEAGYNMIEQVVYDEVLSIRSRNANEESAQANSQPLPFGKLCGPPRVEEGRRHARVMVPPHISGE